jgi:hypothetical protein
MMNVDRHKISFVMVNIYWHCLTHIGGGFDGVGLVVEMGRSLPWYFGTGP